MLPQGCLSEDGYIINQGMLREIPFGNSSYFQSLGIGHGDMVMLILKRRYEFWFSIVAVSYTHLDVYKRQHIQYTRCIKRIKKLSFLHILSEIIPNFALLLE